ncbi:hypothetical protein [uncultured Sphingomonas sp.]|uniref:hypothetical protein n=1 Tax=uncultured Sphingomonas sp. TaxID=158754 RepID=UPI0025ED4F47|nr:hypothetical protein [uncultured Sphingomonas sp.]
MIGRTGTSVLGDLADALRFAAPTRLLAALDREQTVLLLARCASMIPVARPRTCIGV